MTKPMLPLVIMPAQILRQPSGEIKLPLTAEIKVLAQQMLAAMTHYNGIGLAAPQVGQSLRLIVIATSPQPSVYINPEIIKSSWRHNQMEEGCLSLPGVFGIVKRPRRVLARYLTLEGEIKQEWLDDMIARVYQHEVDHLNGILFTDKVTILTKGQELLSQYGLN